MIKTANHRLLRVAKEVKALERLARLQVEMKLAYTLTEVTTNAASELVESSKGFALRVDDEVKSYLVSALRFSVRVLGLNKGHSVAIREMAMPAHEVGPVLANIIGKDGVISKDRLTDAIRWYGKQKSVLEEIRRNTGNVVNPDRFYKDVVSVSTILLKIQSSNYSQRDDLAVKSDSARVLELLGNLRSHRLDLSGKSKQDADQKVLKELNQGFVRKQDIRDNRSLRTDDIGDRAVLSQLLEVKKEIRPLVARAKVLLLRKAELLYKEGYPGLYDVIKTNVNSVYDPRHTDSMDDMVKNDAEYKRHMLMEVDNENSGPKTPDSPNIRDVEHGPEFYRAYRSYVLSARAYSMVHYLMNKWKSLSSDKRILYAGKAEKLTEIVKRRTDIVASILGGVSRPRALVNKKKRDIKVGKLKEFAKAVTLWGNPQSPQELKEAEQRLEEWKKQHMNLLQEEDRNKTGMAGILNGVNELLGRDYTWYDLTSSVARKKDEKSTKPGVATNPGGRRVPEEEAPGNIDESKKEEVPAESEHRPSPRTPGQHRRDVAAVKKQVAKIQSELNTTVADAQDKFREAVHALYGQKNADALDALDQNLDAIYNSRKGKDNADIDLARKDRVKYEEAKDMGNSDTDLGVDELKELPAGDLVYKAYLELVHGIRALSLVQYMAARPSAVTSSLVKRKAIVKAKEIVEESVNKVEEMAKQIEEIPKKLDMDRKKKKFLDMGKKSEDKNLKKEGSASHDKQVALMKWLAGQAQMLGVAEHTYVVGGAVRNWVIKEPIKDIDMMIDSIEAGRDSTWLAQELASSMETKTSLVTNQYGVAILTVSGPWELDGLDMQGEVIEIANARKESYGGQEGKGYKPDQVEPASIQDDVFRREFSFNTLMWRLSQLADGPDKAEIIDLTGKGLTDLKNGVMDTPSDPDKTFSDDPTRMIRAIKFLSKYGFKIKGEVADAIRRNAHKIRDVPSNAIATLLVDVVIKDREIARKSLPAMKDLGLLDVISTMIKEDKEFGAQMSRWAQNRDVHYLFDLLDIGLPLDKSIRFLSSSERERLREVTTSMSREDANALVAALRQPGKALGDKAFLPSLARTMSIGKKEIGIFAKSVSGKIKEILLADPSLLKDPEAIRAEVRQHAEHGDTRKLIVFDFDGTLFGSPDRPEGASRGWFANVESLEEPYVPEVPDSSWWNESVVSQAKKDIADPSTFAVLMTGRAHGNAALRYRIAELLKQKGLEFDAVYMSPGGSTKAFKAKAIRKLVKIHEVTEVEMWEDKQENMDAVNDAIGLELTQHLISPRFVVPTTKEAKVKTARHKAKLVRILAAVV